MSALRDVGPQQPLQPQAVPMKSVHEYHAEATVLFADLEHPLEEKIRPRAHVKLPKDGHYHFKHADPFRFEGVISYRSGYTQVAGHPSSKKDGFATLTTSVLEGINVLDVVTADRVVAQISTVHPEFTSRKQVPSVTFLGTRFENLRIGGHKITIEPALHFLGTPQNDTSYFEDDNVTQEIQKQYNKIADVRTLPAEIRQEFPADQQAWKKNGSIKFSLVDSVSGVPHAYGTPFGHVIDVPHFGRIFLGELIINRDRGNDEQDLEKRIHDKYRFNLTMIRLEMGCVGTGTASLVVADSNGTGSGGKH